MIRKVIEMLAFTLEKKGEGECRDDLKAVGATVTEYYKQ